MAGEDFKYGVIKLSDFGMMMCAPDDDQEFVTRGIDRSEITQLRPKPNHYGVAYDDTFILNFFIMKKDGCNGDQSDFKMTGDEIDEIRSWLESPKSPTELILLPEENIIETHYFGLFTSVQPYLNDGECYGLTMEFTCDSPYGYSEEKTTTSSDTFSENDPVTITFTNGSAERDDYLKPLITIYSSSTFGSDEWIAIKNMSDDEKEMAISLPSGLESITIDCTKKIITDEDGGLVSMNDIGVDTPEPSEYSLVATDMFLFYWLSLVPGTNTLSVTASDTNTIDEIEMKARFVVKTGGF